MPDKGNVSEGVNLCPKGAKPAWEEEILPGQGESWPSPAGTRRKPAWPGLTHRPNRDGAAQPDAGHAGLEEATAWQEYSGPAEGKVAQLRQRIWRPTLGKKPSRDAEDLA
jgi:hypothetical protein